VVSALPDFDSFPAEVRDFYRWCDERGARVLDWVEDGQADGQRFLKLGITGMVVVLRRERQRWFVGVGAQEWSDNFNAHIWDGHLSGSKVKIAAPTPLSAQITFIEDRWEDICASASAPGTLAALRERATDEVVARTGVRLQGQPPS
jgi:hypothetical protein